MSNKILVGVYPGMDTSGLNEMILAQYISPSNTITMKEYYNNIKGFYDNHKNDNLLYICFLAYKEIIDELKFNEIPFIVIAPETKGYALKGAIDSSGEAYVLAYKYLKIDSSRDIFRYPDRPFDAIKYGIEDTSIPILQANLPIKEVLSRNSTYRFVKNVTDNMKNYMYIHDEEDE